MLPDVGPEAEAKKCSFNTKDRIAGTALVDVRTDAQGAPAIAGDMFLIPHGDEERYRIRARGNFPRTCRMIRYGLVVPALTSPGGRTRRWNAGAFDAVRRAARENWQPLSPCSFKWQVDSPDAKSPFTPASVQRGRAPRW